MPKRTPTDQSRQFECPKVSEVKIVQMKFKLKTKSKLKLKFALSSLRFAAFKATTLCQLGQKTRKESSCQRQRDREREWGRAANGSKLAQFLWQGTFCCSWFGCRKISTRCQRGQMLLTTRQAKPDAVSRVGVRVRWHLQQGMPHAACNTANCNCNTSRGNIWQQLNCRLQLWLPPVKL